MLLLDNNWSSSFFITSLLFGIALAMDAFSVSIANSFADPNMKKGKAILIAGTFAFFQAAMPLLGWSIFYGIQQIPGFEDIFKKLVPFVALFLLAYLGIKMILEYKEKRTQKESELLNEIKEEQKGKITKKFLIILLVQGIATSIDALSVGFDTYQYDFIHALVASIIIALMTFVLCSLALFIGKKIGMKIGVNALLVGGIILLLIGLYIFTKGLLTSYFNVVLPSWM